jgi:hypothetical protein
MPRVTVADLNLPTPGGTFSIGREGFPGFAEMHAWGVHVQSELVRVAHPDATYADAGLAALTQACVELAVDEAFIAFVETVPGPPTIGLRYGFQGAFTTDYPSYIWIFVNWTTLEDLPKVVRHEAAHLAFARTHTPEESAGHSGPSEDFALAFEAG